MDEEITAKHSLVQIHGMAYQIHSSIPLWLERGNECKKTTAQIDATRADELNMSKASEHSSGIKKPYTIAWHREIARKKIRYQSQEITNSRNCCSKK